MTAPATKARCAECHAPVHQYERGGFTIKHEVGCSATRGVVGLHQRPYEAVEKNKRRSHFNAKATVCTREHRHPSKVEARVCEQVYLEASLLSGKVWVYRNARLPLFALPATDEGIPHYCNCDWVVVVDDKIVRIVDAKSGKRSRDWERGRAAVEAAYGVKVEERS